MGTVLDSLRFVVRWFLGLFLSQRLSIESVVVPGVPKAQGSTPVLG